MNFSRDIKAEDIGARQNVARAELALKDLARFDEPSVTVPMEMMGFVIGAQRFIAEAVAAVSLLNSRNNRNDVLEVLEKRRADFFQEQRRCLEKWLEANL